MHDGRFIGFEQIYDHYQNIEQRQANLDSVLQQGIKMATNQRQDLTAFLKTLTDYTLPVNKAYRE
jgi:hypothetical protein